MDQPESWVVKARKGEHYTLHVVGLGTIYVVDQRGMSDRAIVERVRFSFGYRD